MMLPTRLQIAAYAHGQDVIHRNVTPTNILRDATNKDVKLGDLTLAKALEGALAQQITRPGEIVGDVAYLSPERTRGTTDVDGRSDLYGLGATVYALLTGHPPCEGSTMSVARKGRLRASRVARTIVRRLSTVGQFGLSWHCGAFQSFVP